MNILTNIWHSRALFQVEWSHVYANQMAWGYFKNTYELLNLRALKFSPVDKIYIFQGMGKIFCVEFQRCPLKVNTKYLTHTLKNMLLTQHWFKSSYIFLKCPPGITIVTTDWQTMLQCHNTLPVILIFIENMGHLFYHKVNTKFNIKQNGHSVKFERNH